MAFWGETAGSCLIGGTAHVVERGADSTSERRPFVLCPAGVGDCELRRRVPAVYRICWALELPVMRRWFPYRVNRRPLGAMASGATAYLESGALAA